MGWRGREGGRDKNAGGKRIIQGCGRPKGGPACRTPTSNHIFSNTVKIMSLFDKQQFRWDLEVVLITKPSITSFLERSCYVIYHGAGVKTLKWMRAAAFTATLSIHRFLAWAVQICWVDFSRVSLPACRAFYCHVRYWRHGFLPQRSPSQQSIHPSCSINTHLIHLCTCHQRGVCAEHFSADGHKSF